MKTQNPIILTKVEKNTVLFFVSFFKIYFVKKKRAIENSIAKKIIKYRRMVETPLNLILQKWLLELLLSIPKYFHHCNLFSKS